MGVMMGIAVRTSGRRVEEVYHELGPRLWRALAAFAGDREIASDAMAEAFAQALAHEDHIRNLSTWVWRAAFTIARGMLKERSAWTMDGHDLLAQTPPMVVDVIKALQQLSANERIAVVLHDYADRPTREIAHILGTSTSTVHVHLFRGRSRLRQLLEVSDDEP